jgi:cyclohexanone monooxygenase
MKAQAHLISEQLGFDPAVIGEKYHVEKEKRIRRDGDTQYQEVKGSLEHLATGLFANKPIKRDPVQATVGALIVGGGYGGILTAVRLSEKGFTDIVIVEKGAEIGGTWFWNRYPGERKLKHRKSHES